MDKMAFHKKNVHLPHGVKIAFKDENWTALGFFELLQH